MSEQKHTVTDDQRVGARDIDKVLEEYGRCGEREGGHCGDHILNTYRLKLLESAKDALCIATKKNTEAQVKNATVLRWAGIALGGAAAAMLTMTGMGWLKLAEFTDKMYRFRESDHIMFEEYRREAQRVDTHQAHILESITDELGKQAAINAQQNEDLQLLQQAFKTQQVQYGPRPEQEGPE